jgi:hypothetical protein
MKEENLQKILMLMSVDALEDMSVAVEVSLTQPDKFKVVAKPDIKFIVDASEVSNMRPKDLVEAIKKRFKLALADHAKIRANDEKI